MDLTKSYFIGAPPAAVWRALTDPAVIEAWGGGPAEIRAEASVATFELRPEGEGTRLTLAHTNVPDDEADEFDVGWDDYYLGPMKELLER